MARTPARKDFGLEEEFDDPDVRAFVRALERLASDEGRRTSEREHLLAVGLFLVRTSTKRSKFNDRLLEQMAAVVRLRPDSTAEERLLRASMLVESSALAFQRSEKRLVIIQLARRVEKETNEPKLRDALRDKEAFAFVAELLRRWVAKKDPRAGQISTNGVLGVLAFRFKLWGILGRDEDNVRRTIAGRIRAAKSTTTVSSPSRKTRAKRR